MSSQHTPKQPPIIAAPEAAEDISIFAINSEQEFEKSAIRLFQQQSQNCSIYKDYVHHLKINADDVKSIDKIPFLPISCFKTGKVVTGNRQIEKIFISSGTTSTENSLHCVASAQLYRASIRKAFERFYGAPSQYCLLALLPHYLEQPSSSLVYMAKYLMDLTAHPQSNFFCGINPHLYEVLQELQAQNQPTLLLGVSFSLLDFVELHKIDFPSLIVMETGGMKGRRQEISRLELHQKLMAGFGVPHIHSEYSMTELLSQAYSKGQGVYECPPWMKIQIRDLHNPSALLPAGQAGGVNVIDLANQYSCAFIQTDDVGISSGKHFEVLGRINNSPLRGCNMLFER